MRFLAVLMLVGLCTQQVYSTWTQSRGNGDNRSWSSSLGLPLSLARQFSSCKSTSCNDTHMVFDTEAFMPSPVMLTPHRVLSFADGVVTLFDFEQDWATTVGESDYAPVVLPDDVVLLSRGGVVFSYVCHYNYTEQMAKTSVLWGKLKSQITYDAVNGVAYGVFYRLASYSIVAFRYTGVFIQDWTTIVSTSDGATFPGKPALSYDGVYVGMRDTYDVVLKIATDGLLVLKRVLQHSPTSITVSANEDILFVSGSNTITSMIIPNGTISFSTTVNSTNLWLAIVDGSDLAVTTVVHPAVGLIAISTSNGVSAWQWNAPSGTDTLSAPSVTADGIAYVSDLTTVFAVNCADGTLLWQHDYTTVPVDRAMIQQPAISDTGSIFLTVGRCETVQLFADDLPPVPSPNGPKFPWTLVVSSLLIIFAVAVVLVLLVWAIRKYNKRQGYVSVGSYDSQVQHQSTETTYVLE